MKRLIYCFFIFIYLNGCSLGPKYKEPVVALPSSYTEAVSEKMETTDNLKSWWKQFNDPILDELIAKSIESNRDLLIAKEKIEEARAFYGLKKADLWPEINADATALRTRISKNIIQPTLAKNPLNVFLIGFDALWELDIFGKLRKAKEAGFYKLEAQRELMQNVYLTLISDVARLYINALALQNKIEIFSNILTIQKNIYELELSKAASGLDSALNTQPSFITLKQAEEDLHYLQTEYKQTIYRLAVLVGLNPEEIHPFFTQDKKSLPQTYPVLPEVLPSNLLRRRPDIREVEKRLQAQTAEIGVAIGEYFPSFSLTAKGALVSQNLNNLLSKNSFLWLAGPILNCPLFSFGRIKSNVEIKRSEQKQVLLQYEKTVLEALKDVENALVAYFNEQKNTELKKEELLAAFKEKNLTEDLYENGMKNLSDLLVIEKKLALTQSQFIDIERFKITNLIALYKALGGDW